MYYAASAKSSFTSFFFKLIKFNNASSVCSHAMHLDALSNGGVLNQGRAKAKKKTG
jgi:hypothetical protein